jgi:hypothetical protein
MAFSISYSHKSPAFFWNIPQRGRLQRRCWNHPPSGCGSAWFSNASHVLSSGIASGFCVQTDRHKHVAEKISANPVEPAVAQNATGLLVHTGQRQPAVFSAAPSEHRDKPPRADRDSAVMLLITCACPHKFASEDDSIPMPSEFGRVTGEGTESALLTRFSDPFFSPPGSTIACREQHSDISLADEVGAQQFSAATKKSPRGIDQRTIQVNDGSVKFVLRRLSWRRHQKKNGR